MCWLLVVGLCVVARCPLFVSFGVCKLVVLVSGVCYLVCLSCLCVVCCLLFVGCRVLRVVCCGLVVGLLCVVRCLLFVVCCMWFACL